MTERQLDQPRRLRLSEFPDPTASWGFQQFFGWAFVGVALFLSFATERWDLSYEFGPLNQIFDNVDCDRNPSACATLDAPLD